jgi:hypothetical protein
MTAVWSDEKAAILAVEWGRGAASTAIAALVGGVTAAAVRRKRSRLGLPSRSPDALQATFYGDGMSVLGAPVPARPEPPAPLPLRGSTPRPWTQRADDECAWPVAGRGGETLSCCLPAEHGEAYCLGHLALLHGKPWPPVDPGNVVLFRGKA